MKYRQVARAAATERTREALLEAATDVFFTGGWAHASLERVAAAAGVSKQTLLRHFGSKRALFDAAALHAMSRVTDERFAAPTDDIAGAVDNLVEHYERYGQRGKILSAATVSANPKLAAYADQGRQLHRDWVQHAFGRWLDQGPAHRRAVVVVLCDVEAWWTLSHHLGLSGAEVRAALAAALTDLLEVPS